MGPSVTPSPTPPADRHLGLSPSPQGTRIAASRSHTPDLGTPAIGQWRYTTPPLDDHPVYYGASSNASPLPGMAAQSALSNTSRDLFGSPPTAPFFQPVSGPFQSIRNIAVSSQAQLDPLNGYSPESRELDALSSRRNRRGTPQKAGARAHQARTKKATAMATDAHPHPHPHDTRPLKKRRAQLKVPRLDQPLSAWAAELQHITVENIEEYVNRSLADRQQEAISAGKIKRELNPFLLYRKAHKNVAEALIRMHSDDASHINPRISKLCGVSWKSMESPAIRTTYKIWSKIEKDRLKEAFPDYRYQPNKRQREEEHEAPAMTSDYTRQDGQVGLEHSQQNFSSDLISLDQTPSTHKRESPWLRDHDSPGEIPGMDFPTQMTTYADPFQSDPFGSPSWIRSRDQMHPSLALAQQMDPSRVDTDHGLAGIDPRLYYGGLNDNFPYQHVPEESRHIPPGQYLLSAPMDVGSSRGPSPEPIGQSWAASVPGNELAHEYLSGAIDDWEFGMDHGASL